MDHEERIASIADNLANGNISDAVTLLLSQPKYRVALYMHDLARILPAGDWRTLGHALETGPGR